jgi:signal transduction histidine kinase/CRP-like cAMP-binding protein
MTINQNKLFSGLTDQELELIRSMIHEKSYVKGTIIIEEGQSDKILYVLIKGRVKVIKITPDLKEVVLAVREEGDFFGEMAILEDAPRSARIIADDDCQVGLICQSEFEKMMGVEPKIAINILKSISFRLRHTNDQIIEQFIQREQNQRQQINRLNSLFEFCKSLTADFDKNSLIKLVPDLIKKHIRYDEIYLFFYDEPAQRFFTMVENGGDPVMRYFGTHENPFTEYLSLNRISVINQPSVKNRENNPVIEDILQLAQTIMLVPFSSNDRFEGWVILKSREPMEWSEDDKAFLIALGSYIYIALQNMKLVAQLVTSEKLSAVGRAASSILHDFKNLLAVVHNYAQFILKSKNEEDINDLVQRILTSSHLMITMSREILLYAKGDTHLNRQPHSVKEILNVIITLIENELNKKKIELITEIPDDLAYDFDKDKISRALYNLMKNASEAVPIDQGKIKITAASVKDELILSVSDNGVGIPESFLNNIFTPFATTKTEGTGLGLMIVKSIVEAHGGKIEIESTEGKGTTVVLTFPIKY